MSYMYEIGISEVHISHYEIHEVVAGSASFTVKKGGLKHV